MTHDDFDYIEHRIYHDYVASIDYNVKKTQHSHKEWESNWTPYEQDLTQNPKFSRDNKKTTKNTNNWSINSQQRTFWKNKAQTTSGK
jgi:hypothetical protein